MTNVKKIESSDENVTKFVVNFGDAVAEAVLYKYPTYADRTVMCISTQSGCPIGCRFCGAGDAFVRNLTPFEITKQVSIMLAGLDCEAEDIRNWQIMFMSMGEPMLNYDAVESAIYRLHNDYPHAKLLISTSGPKVPTAFEKLRHLSMEISQIGLQFSVHESTDERRNKLIPFKNKMTLQEIVVEGIRWRHASGRKPFFNYCASPDNTSQEDAEGLLFYFNPVYWEATVSVICERDESVAEANARQLQLALDFQEKLQKRGFSTRCFNPGGQDDIGGGCGQLFHVQQWMKNNPELAHKSCGTGLDPVHSPTVK